MVLIITMAPNGCKLNRWLYGYYVMAKFATKRLSISNYTISKQINYLYNHLQKLTNNPWLSLPELTNNNGDNCEFSCPSQLWSIATLLEAINLLKL